MFLTRECDYAIRVVRGLTDMEIKPVSVICERELIPRPFAYKILKKLEKAGIVSAHRGPVGGYRLTKTPDCVTLFDIVNAVDERLFINECLLRDYVCPHNAGGNICGIHRELIRVQQTVTDALSEKTIGELI